MVNGQETAVCVFSGQIVQLTSVDPPIEKRCCASATLFQMNSPAPAYIVTVLSLYCYPAPTPHECTGCDRRILNYINSSGGVSVICFENWSATKMAAGERLRGQR